MAARDPTDDGDTPPEAAETFRVGHDEIEAPAVRLETLGLAEAYGVESDDSMETASVIFGVGDEVPAELAEMWWPAFSDKLEAFDADGECISQAVGRPATGFLPG